MNRRRVGVISNGLSSWYGTDLYQNGALEAFRVTSLDAGE